MRDVLIGQTDYTVLVRITGTDGAPETGLAHTDIDIAYARVETDNDVTTSDVAPADLASLTAAHSDWGWEEVSATDHPGLYRLDIADAVFASGAWESVVTITDASGSDFYAHDIGFRLVSFNVQDGVRLGLTALPNAAADAAGGLPISDAGGLDLDAKIGALTYGTANRVNAQVYGMEAGTVTATAVATGAIDADAIADNAIDAGAIADGAITAAKIADGAIDAATFAAGAITAAAIATNAIDDDALAVDAVTAIQSGLATAAALATVDGIVDDILLDTAEIGTAGAGLTNINLPNQTMDIVGNITGNLSGSVGSVTGAVGSVTGAVGSVTAGVTLANDAITAAKFDESTAFPLASADTGSTAVARTGADADTLETLSDEIAALLTAALTEGYRGAGATGSVRDLLYEIIAHLGESSIVGTTKTLKKLDGSTTAKTYTLDSAATPTAITETT